eukprot:5181919-Pyramimonas_sp.AAC.2
MGFPRRLSKAPPGGPRTPPKTPQRAPRVPQAGPQAHDIAQAAPPLPMVPPACGCTCSPVGWPHFRSTFHATGVLKRQGVAVVR